MTVSNECTQHVTTWAPAGATPECFWSPDADCLVLTIAGAVGKIDVHDGAQVRRQWLKLCVVAWQLDSQRKDEEAVAAVCAVEDVGAVR